MSRHSLILPSGGSKPLSEPPGMIVLAARKEAGAVVEKNSGASLIHWAMAGVLEFHTKMNAVGGDSSRCSMRAFGG